MYISFINGKNNTNGISTVSLANQFCNFRLSNGSLVNVQIMDTAGQEAYRAINASYCKKADCCLLVYDISNRQSFEECKTYYNEMIKKDCPNNVKVIVLGNKTDLEEKREVPFSEGSYFSFENHYIFMETSCLKNERVFEAFTTLIEITIREALKNNEKEKKDNITIKNRQNNKRETCCKKSST